MRRLTLFAALALLASPAGAQQIITFGAGGDGGSTATFTTQDQLPDFEGPYANATVLGGVNIRSAPNSHGSQIIGALNEGDVVSARCKYGWCELAEAGGYTAERFLNFNGAADPAAADQTFETLQPPADGDVSTGDAPPVNSATIANAKPAIAANFDGLWTVADPSGQPGMPLILKQTDSAVTGTLQSLNRVAKITGEIEGSKLSFTYDMLNKAGKTIASGNGFFTIGQGGSTLAGVLMLNGLVVSNIRASR